MSELARIERGGLVRTFDEAARAANAMAQSEYFSDAKSAAQAMVKVLAGFEMGFGPFASMSGIHVIKGKPSIGANLMAAAVKSHPRYDYRVRKMGDDAVALEFFERGESVGVSEFTKADAQKAGTQNMGKFPRNMLFARAMSNGVKWFCPDVFNGSAVYTPDELGAEVDEDGDIVVAEVREIKPNSNTITVEEIAATQETQSDPDYKDGGESTPSIRCLPDQLKELIEKSVTRRRGDAFSFHDKRKNYLIATVGNLESCFPGDKDATTKRHAVMWYLTGKETSKNMDDAEIKALHGWLNATKGEDDTWSVDPEAAKEAHAVYAEAMREMGQQPLFADDDPTRPF